ncbi:hypothetical protein [Candidatus Methanoperedens nitratireducens]|uniref:Uncharacterized protein n=1 Tax=Candidatus Methanoperedens nitratireducens TaxID=1392998 RepID=A0A284VS77_9EURY|nr:hypothetical protein [Candidatus Methanoperedens nitroreducens]SNQ62140.1 exported hypothetical protein [Candidatus Methanoperedens nitroreducens]
MKWICLLVAGLMISVSIAVADEELSSAQLSQIAVDRIGDSSQEADISGFDEAESSQIGYSSDGIVTQTISYENIGNGSILQWGESGDMKYKERSFYFDQIGDEINTTNWINGDVNQTIYIRNSSNLYLKQVVGGLKNILFPDQQTAQVERENGAWWFCGKAVNNRSGLPLCADKFAKKIYDGKATESDFYKLQALQENYDVFPSENLTLHVILTKWNMTRTDDNNLSIKFRAYNFGKKTYNATIVMDLVSKVDIVSLEGSSVNADNTQNWQIKMPSKRNIELGTYTVQSMKEIDKVVKVPLEDIKVNSIEMKVMSE